LLECSSFYPSTDLLRDNKRCSAAPSRDGPRLAEPEPRGCEPDAPVASSNGEHEARGSLSTIATKDVLKKPVGAIGPSSTTSRTSTFPTKFLSILESSEFQDVVWWVPGGDAFCILQQGFTERVLQIHFQATLFESFVRKIRRYGFRSADIEGLAPGVLAFHHKSFHRDRPELVSAITRAKRKSATPPRNPPPLCGMVSRFDGPPLLNPTTQWVPPYFSQDSLHLHQIRLQSLLNSNLPQQDMSIPSYTRVLHELDHAVTVDAAMLARQSLHLSDRAAQSLPILQQEQSWSALGIIHDQHRDQWQLPLAAQMKQQPMTFSAEADKRISKCVSCERCGRR
jgi:hypothetical protein